MFDKFHLDLRLFATKTSLDSSSSYFFMSHSLEESLIKLRSLLLRPGKKVRINMSFFVVPSFLAALRAEMKIYTNLFRSVSFSWSGWCLLHRFFFVCFQSRSLLILCVLLNGVAPQDWMLRWVVSPRRFGFQRSAWPLDHIDTNVLGLSLK